MAASVFSSSWVPDVKAKIHIKHGEFYLYLIYNKTKFVYQYLKKKLDEENIFQAFKEFLLYSKGLDFVTTKQKPIN